MAMAGGRMGKLKDTTSNISYRKGSVFKAGPGAILAHACNAQGSWGAGVALQFKKKFPKAFEDYKKWCEKDPEVLVGSYLKLKEETNTVVCLFTSAGYGDRKDTPEDILKNTETAVRDFIMTVPYKGVVHSPKINAGLFNVPWNKTEAIIKSCLNNRPDVQWVVWEI